MLFRISANNPNLSTVPRRFLETQHPAKGRAAMDFELFELGEQLDEAHAKLEGVCELLDCAAAAPDEIGSAGLACIAELAREAHGDLACGIGLLERTRALERAEGEAAEEEDGERFNDGSVLSL